MNAYPRTIDNGGGERLTFLRVVSDASGDRLEAENRLQPGAGPPMHVHHLQEEGLTVVAGKMGYRIAGKPNAVAEEGETVVFPAGQAHRFWNAGAGELVCRGYLSPPLNFEYMLTSSFESMKQNGGRPGIFDAAFLFTRYRREFELTDVPVAVRRLLFPLIAALGRALGKYDKFADAPEPADESTQRKVPLSGT